ncbi:hypothetical protein C2S51_017891 [Perilla frutescens var. frutescens]|nr:hypothetical protein C2S51_017891 [Perilla frutescens var. frutescens]
MFYPDNRFRQSAQKDSCDGGIKQDDSGGKLIKGLLDDIVEYTLIYSVGLLNLKRFIWMISALSSSKCGLLSPVMVLDTQLVMVGVAEGRLGAKGSWIGKCFVWRLFEKNALTDYKIVFSILIDFVVVGTGKSGTFELRCRAALSRGYVRFRLLQNWRHQSGSSCVESSWQP